MNERGIIPGIKVKFNVIQVDKGTENIAGLNDETFTKGLDSLQAMTKEFYNLGCRFAKWRAVLRIGEGCPSELAIK